MMSVARHSPAGSASDLAEESAHAPTVERSPSRQHRRGLRCQLGRRKDRTIIVATSRRDSIDRQISQSLLALARRLAITRSALTRSEVIKPSQR